MTYCLTLWPLFMQQPYFTPMWCCRGCSLCLPPLRELSLGRIGLFVMPTVLLGTTERMETLMLLLLRFLARDWESKWPVSKSEMFDDRKEQIRINTILQWDCKQQYSIYEETDDIVTNCLGFNGVKFNYELNQCLYQH